MTARAGLNIELNLDDSPRRAELGILHVKRPEVYRFGAFFLFLPVDPNGSA